MNPNQSLNLNADFLGGFSAVFLKIVFAIIAVYVLIMILNFLRDKFINQETDSKKDDISDLLSILNKLFFISGFGFIIGNIVHFMLSQISRNNGNMAMSFRGEWDYFTFGIILIFIGIGLKSGKELMVKDRKR